jgi:hypothetical protein
MMNNNVKQYYTRELKQYNFVEIGQLAIHEDCLLTELHHSAFEELKLFEASDQRMDQSDLQCKSFRSISLWLSLSLSLS